MLQENARKQYSHRPDYFRLSLSRCLFLSASLVQCLEAVRDTLDDLAYYLLRRAPSSLSSAAAAVACSSSSLSHLKVVGGNESPLTSRTDMGGSHTPSGSVDDGGDIGDNVSDSSSHAIDAASRELALRCAHNIARSSRALGTDVI